MNLRKTEIELTLSNLRPMGVMPPLPYYSERTQMFDKGVQICANGLNRYVTLPKGTEKITLAFYKRRMPESFEIGRREMRLTYSQSLLFREIMAYCLVDHPRTQLLRSFRGELYRYYINGYKFIRIEY